MNDKGHEQTDKELKRIEQIITKEYKQAAQEIEDKMLKHFEAFNAKDAVMRKKMDSGEITKTEYNNWRIGQIATGDRWRALRDSLTETLVNADKTATRIIQENSLKAYGDNMNYGTYEIEHGSQINTGFNLYDADTIINLMKDDPKIIPIPRLDIPKDEQWNRQHLSSAVLQGILQGESIPKIADRLQEVAFMGRNSALRNARTYTTAAENKGRIDSYERAEKMGIKTNKKWIATLDDRTRMEHRHLDGMSVPYDSNFEVDGYEIGFPGDPSAEPEMFYNCRCTLVADIVGYPYNDERNDSKLGEMTYEEWKHAKDKESTEPEKAETTGTAWIDRIKEIQQMDKLDEKTIKEAGDIMVEQIHSGYFADLKKERDELQTQCDQAKERWMNTKARVDEIQYSTEFQQARYIHSGTMDVSKSEYFATFDDAENYFQEQHAVLEELQAIRAENYKEYTELSEKLVSGDIGKTADMLVEMLSNVREMGTDGIDVGSHLGNSKSPIRKNVEWAYSKYPKSWVQQSVDNSDLKLKKTSRGYYSDWEKTIAISGDGKGADRTAIHELGHRFEDVVSNILSNEKEFYDRRTDGDKLEWLGSGYRKDEKTRKDDFLSKYMGKDYGGKAYELVSMGFEYAYCDPVKLSEDADMESWIYGLLAVIP